ncbi:hypothetical protein F7725_017659 [Dissostichus mawsoni]|uniref:L1 transposable element RRM domain-containing protein n=1 Tax=Dissostichus mawsoni TaxID=36200 RepID=A0A7J5Z5M8_DISMA|nr:hypothetical protein F7725_017659 [Dissostichus mawsoni]
MPKKSNVKFDQSGEPGPNEALGSTNKGATDDSSILGAIAALHAELTLVKSEICRKIETEISEVTTTLRGEITALKAENDAAITTLTAQIDSQNQTLKELTEAANGSSDIVQELESKVKTLCGQVGTLSEKCLDLEGRSKRQNLRVAGVKEGKENGQRTGFFMAELLKETLGLENAPEIDRAHRALRRRAGDNEPPRHLIARVHYCPAFEDIMKKVISTRDLTFKGQRIQIFRDLPTEVVKRRAAFTPTRRILRDKPGVRFGLLYPAKLRVSHKGSERFFTDPEEARNTRNVSSGLQRRSKMSALRSGAKTKRP